jgi:hypothetical protein
LTVLAKAKRFFTVRRVTTRIDSMLGFLDQCVAGRFIEYIRTLVFRVDTTLWQLWDSELYATIPALWSERIYNQTSGNKLLVSESTSRDLANIFQRMTDHRLRFASFTDVLALLPDSMGIWIEPQNTNCGLDLNSVYTIQHCLIRDFLESIHQSAKKIVYFQIGPAPPGRLVYAVAARTLDPLHINFENYTTLRTLSIEYHPDDGNKFLSVLSQTKCLRTFMLKQKCVGIRSAKWSKRSDKILHLLGDRPKFSLHTLELKGIFATSPMTFDSIFRAHATTLRYISLEDVKLRPPNSILAFFEALAEIELEHVGLNKFEPKDGIRWVPCQETWTVVYDGDEGEDTACAGEECGHDSCSGWSMLTRVNQTTHDWLIYEKGGNNTKTVKELMADMVVAAKCGAI